MKLKVLCASTVLLGLFGCQSTGQVKVLDAHYISPAHAAEGTVVETAKKATLDKKAATHYQEFSGTSLPVYYTVEPGYLKDQLEQLRVRLGLTQVVWHSSIPDCLDWPIGVRYQLDVRDTGTALQSFFKGYPLVPKWFQGNGVVQVLPEKPLYQYGDCEDV